MASEYLKWKYRDVQPDKPVELTKKQRRRNWWHYHKWHVLLSGLALCIAGDLAWHILTQVHPDYQVAYVSADSLPEEAERAWIEKLSALGADCNGDGRIVVQINQYLVSPDSEQAMYNYASSVKLMADLESNDSYFFLLADPEGFQNGYGVLREDWFPVEDGLYLARRAFEKKRVPENLEDCDRLWEQLAREAA